MPPELTLWDVDSRKGTLLHFKKFMSTSKTTSSPEKDQPVTWQMNESEASYFSEMLNQSITSITERSAV